MISVRVSTDSRFTSIFLNIGSELCKVLISSWPVATETIAPPAAYVTKPTKSQPQNRITCVLGLNLERVDAYSRTIRNRKL